MNLSGMFQTVLSLSLTGSVVIALVLIARLGLKRLSRRGCCLLWAVVLFRLLCPVALPGPVSLIPAPVGEGQLVEQLSQQYVGEVERLTQYSQGYQLALAEGRTPVEEGNIKYIPAKVGTSEEPDTVGNTWLVALGWLWAVGVACMAGYGLVSSLRLRRRLVGATPLEAGVYLCDDIPTPFVLGIVRPRVYLPSHLSEKEQKLVLAHERCHLRRGDHVAKGLGFVALCVHWFNPLVWVAYACAGRDLEVSCDEGVVEQLGESVRADYAACLLHLSTGQRAIRPTPLAFGQGDTGARIRHLSRWKLPRAGVTALATVICLVLSACMATNPVEQPQQSQEPVEESPEIASYMPEKSFSALTPQQMAELGLWETIMQNATVYTLTDESHQYTPQQAAQTLAKAFFEDLKKPSKDRSFCLIQYAEPQVELTWVPDLEDEEVFDYAIQSSQKYTDCWVVDVSTILVYDGTIDGTQDWGENTDEDDSLEFLLQRTDTGYSFQSRHQ